MQARQLRNEQLKGKLFLRWLHDIKIMLMTLYARVLSAILGRMKWSILHRGTQKHPGYNKKGFKYAASNSDLGRVPKKKKQ